MNYLGSMKRINPFIAISLMEAVSLHLCAQSLEEEIRYLPKDRVVWYWQLIEQTALQRPRTTRKAYPVADRKVENDR